MISRVDEILAFWFGLPNEPNYGKPRSFWFTKKPKFDLELRHRFLIDYEQAVAGNLDSWYVSPQSCLALILLFDQYKILGRANTPEETEFLQLIGSSF